MEIFSVSFFGHRCLSNSDFVDKKVYEIICDLIRNKNYIEFLVGREGDFDQVVSSAIIRAKRNIDLGNAFHIWIMPYMKAEYINNKSAFEKYYDSIEVCEKSSVAFPKSAITIRNQYMIERSDMCVFYVAKKNGGAWKAMKYAGNIGKSYINIAIVK